MGERQRILSDHWLVAQRCIRQRVFYHLLAGTAAPFFYCIPAGLF